MSHLIKIYSICKFSYFRLWQLKSQRFVKYEVSLDLFRVHKKNKTQTFGVNGNVLVYNPVKSVMSRLTNCYVKRVLMATLLSKNCIH